MRYNKAEELITWKKYDLANHLIERALMCEKVVV